MSTEESKTDTPPTEPESAQEQPVHRAESAERGDVAAERDVDAGEGAHAGAGARATEAGVGAPNGEPASAHAPTTDAGDASAGDGSSEGASAEGADAEGGDAEGGDDEASAEAGAAGGEAASGEAKKKRRRRRRKKKPGEAAAAGAEGEGDGEGEASAEGEGEGEASEGEPGAAADKKKRKKRRKPLAGPPAFNVGEEVFGRVMKITDDAVWIDIAGKAQGLFDRRELLDDEPPAEGDQFIAVVASNGERGGMLMLARGEVDVADAKAKVQAALLANEVVSGFVTAAVKGGVEVDVDGLRAFCPASHIDLRPGSDLSHLVGRRFEFHVVQYEKAGRDVVVSRKKMLESEALERRAGSLKKLEPGSIHKGVVRSVVAWGVFVAIPDADDIEGLVHMSEASHDRGQKLTDLFAPGKEIDVKVLRVDEKGKLWLSHKQALPDPWSEMAAKYPVGSVHKGKVVRLQSFGAFVELEPGVDGLIHTADLSIKQIAHPEDVVKVDSEIDVVVVSCDSRRIGLHPALPPDEASEPKQKVGPHKSLAVKVVQAVEGGLLVRVLGVTGRMARAFIPAGHTGTPRGTDLRKEFPVGTRIEAKVLDVDPRRGEAKLSIKALKQDAERQAYQEYRQGVARDAKFGTFADLLKKD